MEKIIHHQTDIEKTIDTDLQKYFIKNQDYCFQYPIRFYGYNLDFAFPKEKIDIECDGEYWHLKENNHDRKRNWYLQNHGWTILRFTDKQIKEDLSECVEKIKEEVEKKRQNHGRKKD